MDPFDIYEDLSLFSGDLLQGFSLLANEQPETALQLQDGPSTINKASDIEADDPTPSAKVVFGQDHPGSTELGLTDLLAGSPAEDLLSPLESAWMDTNLDLLDLLTSDTDISDIPSSEATAQISSSLSSPSQLQLSIPSPGEQAAVVPSTSAPTTPDPVCEETSLESSLDFLQNLLSAEGKVDLGSQGLHQDPGVLDAMTLAGQDHIVQCDTQQGITTEDEDIFMDLDATGLENLLGPSMNAPIEEGHVLSPVSTDDVESVLSSSPPSPGLSSIITLDASYSPAPPVDNAHSPINVSFASDNVSEDVFSATAGLEGMEDTKSPAPGPETTQKTSIRSEPYSKAGGKQEKVPDRKKRKQEQNRAAASRYRQKKHQQKGTVHDEYEELEVRNKELKDQVDSISREINCLKDLLSDVYKTKGLVPPMSPSVTS